MHLHRWIWGCSFFDHPSPGPWDPYTTTRRDGSEKSQTPRATATGYSDVLSSGFKVDTLLKIDTSRLIQGGLQRSRGEHVEPVETRNAQELWDAQEAGEETGEPESEDEERRNRGAVRDEPPNQNLLARRIELAREPETRV